jgi:hypothetical protein
VSLTDRLRLLCDVFGLKLKLCDVFGFKFKIASGEVMVLNVLIHVLGKAPFVLGLRLLLFKGREKAGGRGFMGQLLLQLRL